MKYELANIEAIVNSLLKFSFDTDQSEVNNTEKLRETVVGEVEGIKSSFINAMFTCERERCFEQYIHFHQQTLIKMINALFRLQTRPINQNLIREFVEFVSCQLDTVLQFIEKHFSKYFDTTQNVPESRRSILLDAMNEKQSQIDILLQEASIDPKLASLYKIPILKLLKCPELMSYDRLLFITEMQLEVLQIDLSLHPEKTLRSLLIYLNFNTPQVFTYLTSFVNDTPEHSVSEQIEKLSFHAKEISQSFVKPYFAYDDRAEPLKNQLLFWVNEEIEYLQKKRAIAIDTSQKIPDGGSVDFKIILDISVAQLACLIKAFTEAKVIQNQNISELIRFFSSNVKTKRAENISYESLRIKFYNVESGTKDAVKKIIQTTSQCL